MRRVIYIAVCIGLLLAIGACKPGSKEQAKEEQTETNFELSMQERDTAEVKALVDRFFQYAISKDFTEAAAMLYRIDKRSLPELLNNEEMAKVRGMLKALPMVDYRIEYIKFNKNKSNEVLCYVIMQKAEEGKPELSTKMFFKPVKVLEEWYLCLTNTEYGDRGVVKPNKRDSVKKAYQESETIKTSRDED